MQKMTLTCGVGLATVLMLTGISTVSASTGYTVDPRGTVVRDGSGGCVQTPRWEKDLAIEGCPGYEAPEPAPRAEPEPAPAPELAPEPRYETITLGSEVLFATGKHALSPAATAELDAVARRIMDAGSELERVMISGHTDSTGPRSLNERLSQDRADAVKDYLVDQGVPADKMQTVGYGPDRPQAYNDTAEGRMANRRVEIRIEKTERVN
ncbi:MULTISPECIES: OmpA family protein [unclassified Ectothiorhodospira]|uniref:OmpA family protein n=1 Tax=unclassified Ectothiorhodospira TaxID=2684909 RepID=UPI001EE7E56B|nr:MULTISPECIES: OmpA family protein [unclassified Ectothiorhodospira]MCG5515156.1 OmpA family protein [Ectothiorhodospira sp. 9100]MCG5519657.1 OmpA family protein [Ectothiorhodospira sp. 9905]